MPSNDLGGFQAPRWSQPTSQPSHPNLGQLGGSSYMPSGGAGDPSLQLRQDYMSTHQRKPIHSFLDVNTGNSRNANGWSLSAGQKWLLIPRIPNQSNLAACL